MNAPGQETGAEDTEKDIADHPPRQVVLFSALGKQGKHFPGLCVGLPESASRYMIT